MRAAALIPARGGSKGIPQKNLIPFCGLPLMAWSIKQAIDAGLPAFVSTDDEEIARCGAQFGATPIDRPKELATDNTLMGDVLRHAIRVMPCDTIVLLQPTNPLRRPGDMRTAMQMFEREKAAYLASVTVKPRMQWSSRSAPMVNVGRNPRRQDVASMIVEHGLIYIYDEQYEPLGPHYTSSDNRVTYETEDWQAIEIDAPQDIKPCEALMKGMILNV